jgi:predicted MFS family arabinose efflux permease
MTNTKPAKQTFTGYQIFIITVLAILQFTIILDFMVISPLGAMLIPKLKITPSQFGLVVSAYAFSAGISGLLAAGFADKFDRKKLLLFFYTGFILGTTLCAFAPDYQFLMIARIVTGIFGGVISSIGMAIITDLFKMEVRGRVMGFIQMAFAASQVLGLPIGLLLADKFNWHAPFEMIVGFGVLLGIVMAVYMKPVTGHLHIKSTHNPLTHLYKTVSNPAYLIAFLATTMLSTGGFMLMPFGSTFSVNNLGIKQSQLFELYFITGIFAFSFGPLVGMLSDKLGKYKIFVAGSIISLIMVAVYTNLAGVTPLWYVVTINVIMFGGITARMISSSALISGIPQPQDRGAFMSINASVQQISGGIASSVAGAIISQSADGKLQHMNILGYCVITSMSIVIGMMYLINRQVTRKAAKAPVPQPVKEEELAEAFVIE